MLPVRSLRDPPIARLARHSLTFCSLTQRLPSAVCSLPSALCPLLSARSNDTMVSTMLSALCSLLSPPRLTSCDNPQLAIDETVIIAGALYPSLLIHPLKVEGDCSRMTVSSTATRSRRTSTASAASPRSPPARPATPTPRPPPSPILSPAPGPAARPSLPAAAAVARILASVGIDRWIWTRSSAAGAL